MYEALYIHIPFCKHRCTYCDFETKALPQAHKEMDLYLESLLQDIRAASKAGDLQHIRTLYIGGGTPTHFGHARLVELAYLLSLSMRLEQVTEYTIEANPESLSPALVRDLYAMGVNRLSLGVQSFINEELLAIGRIHDASQAIQAFREARERFDNISLDLMCGLPRQTASSWQKTLEQALLLEPEHVSVYPLQVEEGTPLAHSLALGSVRIADDDEVSEYLEMAARLLGSAGYHRYEVASYALPGKESKHNRCYWTGVEYLGLGQGAASMKHTLEGTRIRCVRGGETEELTCREALAEDLMLAMRMNEGIRPQLLQRAQGMFPGLNATLKELEDLALIKCSNGGCAPTERGWLLGNELYGRLWSLGEERGDLSSL